MNTLGTLVQYEVHFAAAAALSILLHEAAHILLALAAGVRVKRIGLTWRGVFIVREQGSPLTSACISLAGPALNLFLAIVYRQAAPIFAQVNLVIGISNLLPVQGTDGVNAWQMLKREQKLR